MTKLNRIKTAVLKIRKNKPASWPEFKYIGLRLDEKPLGEGAFRQVFKIKGLPLVVKFPLADDDGSKRNSKMHTTMEVKRVLKLSKLRWIRKYLPKIYYHDRKTGVLVMEYYEPLEDLDWCIAEFIEKSITAATGMKLGDIQASNFGVKLCGDECECKTLKIIDLGL